MGHIGEPWVSHDLAMLLGQLTPQQAEGVRRIVQAELRGETLTSLLIGPDKICTSTTYYGAGKTHRGWKNKPAFIEALQQARIDYRSWLMEHGAADALVLLTEAGPPAVVELKRQATGDEKAVAALGRKLDEAIEAKNEELVRIFAQALGGTATASARAFLERALAVKWHDPETYQTLAYAMATIARALDSERQRAAMGILDRIDVKTASKSSVIEGGDKRIVHDLSGLPAEILRLLADGGDETGAGSGSPRGTE